MRIFHRGEHSVVKEGCQKARNYVKDFAYTDMGYSQCKDELAKHMLHLVRCHHCFSWGIKQKDLFYNIETKKRIAEGPTKRNLIDKLKDKTGFL